MQHLSMAMICLKASYHCAATAVTMNAVRVVCDTGGSLDYDVNA